MKNNVLYQEWVYTSNPTSTLLLVAPKSMRKDMYQLYNIPTAEHLGRAKTLNSICRRFYWPGMTSDVERLCKCFTVCARRKAGPGLGKSPIQHCPTY